MTDHGNIFGAVHFFDAMKKKNLKPILGCELYVCKEDDHRGKPDPDSKYNHFLVLAENEAGYRNLVRLTSEAALHGFYRKAAGVSKKFLAKHAEGLIGFSGCLAGEMFRSTSCMGTTRRRRPSCGDSSRRCLGVGTSFLKCRTMA